MNNLVSIIMPSYNTCKYIAQSINSVINQTYTDWELIIVDDCSTDETDDVVAPFLSNERIIYLKNDKNSGAAVSRNYALRQAKGKWIAFLDSDDIWYKNKLEWQIAFMEQYNYKFSFTDYRIEQNNKLLPYVFIGPDVVTRRKLYNYCYFSTITVMYDREYVGLIQIEDIRKNNDYAMWFEISKICDCYRFPLCLSIYVKHDGSVSSGSKIKLIKHHYILFRKALKKGKILSFLLTLNNVWWGFIKKIKYKKKINIQQFESKME